MKPNLFDYDAPDRAPGGGDVILRGLSAAEWEAFVAFAEPLRYPAGAAILRAGEGGRAIYIVKSGHVRGALAQGGAATAELGPGAVFGEVAFFDGAPRSASLWAVDAVELLVLPMSAFDKLAAWHPRVARELLLDLGRVLATRLRRAEARA
ncbi:MAG: cyclic nucleotide-binding domain-containing protein [Burkholderiales bacterium]|nr:cyclic nucleotide-binding domain-containing protein [Burkholderiales bacterium]MDE1927536.1 cyclic nucleotide-binding domain-containing protein [Burkholderiales bacterium]MDE2160376.1 cyclic nucleotide-binding domain-containing protein [Burkholderiales bacterium]MDE2505309.1 cyclic nucleotide-binding domain-containing protein [Burkholderiales bacterium]